MLWLVQLCRCLYVSVGIQEEPLSTIDLLYHIRRNSIIAKRIRFLSIIDLRQIEIVFMQLQHVCSSLDTGQNRLEGIRKK